MLLVLCTLMLQAPNAEKVLEKLEAALLNADTVEVRLKNGFQEVSATPKWEPKGEGDLSVVLLGKGGKWRYESRAPSGANREVRDVFVSDGLSAWYQAHLYVDGEFAGKSKRPIEVPMRDAPKEFNAQVVIAFVRAGAAGVSNVVHAVFKGREEPTPNAREWFKVSKVVSDADDKDLKTIRFMLEVDLGSHGGKYKQEIKLWYEPKAMCLVRRWEGVLRPADKPPIETCVWESYDELKIDTKVADSQFKPIKTED